jgi:hypothetical protein
VAGLSERSEVVSVGRELVVAACPVAGVDDAPTEEVFGAYITALPTKTTTTPVNSAIVPKKSCFGLEFGRAWVGSGGGTMADCGGAPHEGQAVANELISLPHS